MSKRQSAYQRWELASFDAAPPPPVRPAPSVAEIEALEERVRTEAYAAGYEEGRAAVEAEAARLKEIATGLEAALESRDERAARELLDLALALARALVREALALKPELVLPGVAEALRALPAFGTDATLIVNPEDAPLVRRHLGEAAPTILERTDVERGGCRVETPAGSADATLETRWQRVIATLGRSDAWQS